MNMTLGKTSMVIWDVVYLELLWPKGKIIPITPLSKSGVPLTMFCFGGWLVHFHLAAHLNLSLLHKTKPTLFLIAVSHQCCAMSYTLKTISSFEHYAICFESQGVLRVNSAIWC